MNSKQKPPQRRKAILQAEMLETRALMTSGAGNTFAIMQSSIAKANQKVSLPFNYTPSLITTTAKGQITLGIDVAANSSNVIPKIVGVMDGVTHKMIPMSRAMYTKAVQRATPSSGPQTTAVLITLHIPKNQINKDHAYDVVVEGEKKTTGAFLAGFYLPGDANGDGGVQSSDITLIQGAMNVSASSSSYVFAYDANRDGIINKTDLKIAEQNLGAVTNITPVVSANLNPASDSGIQDRITNIQNVEFDGQATPGSTITYTDTDNTSPVTTTTANTLGQYSLHVPLGPGDNTFQVTATDGFGQSITGTIAPVSYSLSAPAAGTPTIPDQQGVTSAPTVPTTTTPTTTT
jgi:Dockerin type I domain/Bacterial Ig-like domain